MRSGVEADTAADHGPLCCATTALAALHQAQQYGRTTGCVVLISAAVQSDSECLGCHSGCIIGIRLFSGPSAGRGLLQVIQEQGPTGGPRLHHSKGCNRGIQMLVPAA